MNSAEKNQTGSEESVTFSIKRSSRNAFLAKVIILLSLSLLGGHFLAQHNFQQYEQGRALTQEKYMEGYDQYQSKLLSAKQYDNPLMTTFVMLMVLSFFIGSYELTALIVGLLIGKVIRR